jgi:transcription initiation factor TFIIF subunit beta
MMDIKAEPPVKLEVDPETGMNLDEEDLYEDAGDLEFYDKDLPGDPYGMVYMAKVPKFVWDAWSKLDDDAEIRIGTIRQWYDPTPDGGHKVRSRIAMFVAFGDAHG